MTPLEGWYLACLVKWTKVKKRAPVLHELAAFCRKSQTAVYSALISLEHKGYVTRVGTSSKMVDRRFRAVEVAQ